EQGALIRDRGGQDDIVDADPVGRNQDQVGAVGVDVPNLARVQQLHTVPPDSGLDAILTSRLVPRVGWGQPGWRFRFHPRISGQAESVGQPGEWAFRYFRSVGTLWGISLIAVYPPATWLVAGSLDGAATRRSK